mmetsp:Transcript_2757/g.8685  ORF Transcript_2757/g.8685 Transcript_2757/m.8685 type:complete len:97 (+) Transcript_2757:151-441(+)
MDFLAKFKSKAEKDPLVPIGCMATLSCLLAGLYTFQQGQAALSQKMMRARVVAQGATVVVLAVGTLAASKVKNPEDERPKGMHPIEYEAMKAEQGK